MHPDRNGLIAALLLAVCLFACGRPSQEPDHDHAGATSGERHDVDAEHEAGAGHAEETAGRVSLTGVRGVAFSLVGPPVEEGVWRPAEAGADESERLALSAPAAGVVAAIHVPPGRQVAAGTPLVTLRSPELAGLTGAWLSRRATREQAAAEVAREARLAAAGAGAARELEAARTALEVALAEETAARLALEARGVTPGAAGATIALRAPRQGRVAGYSVLSGAGVETGQEVAVFETGRASLVRVELPLPGPPAWAPGVVTTVRRGDGLTWQAAVEGLPSSLSPETRRLRYRLRITSGEPPVAGTPLEVRVPLPAGLVVPQDALQQIEGEWGVFVADGDEVVFTPVRRGPDLGGDVVVLAGISPGQRIATSGAYLLKALALKHAGAGETHAH